jgi:ubiquinone/menaquinone biosynthesis C-methylase UbiE
MHALLLVLGALAALWVAWRLYSRKQALPCPAFFSWLVELENPFARVTRSASVIQHLGLGTGARVADIGCGPGRATLPLARAVGPEGEVIALDLQAEMLAKVARKVEANGLANVRLLQGDARVRTLPEQSLDGAVLVMALGEIPEHPRVFAMIHSVLMDGGKLLVTESIFDPHYVRLDKVRAQATAAGFVEQCRTGNFCAYSIRFEKPNPAQAAP